MQSYPDIHVHIGGGAEGEGRGAVASPLADKGGGETVSNAPHPFRRLSGMMPASTEKIIGIYR